MDIGLIGLGVMGENLILNIEEKGYSVSVYNRTTTKTDDFIKRNKEKRVTGYEDIHSFVSSLSSPKKIILMIKSGPAVDAMIDKLIPFLKEEDVIVDAGNSFYEDTKERCTKYKGIFSFLGVGISGGEVGARKGPSIMVGGEKEGWLKMKEIFEKISAKSENVPCCAYFGSNGAGHFIKMIHNGIEYCEMQIITEIYFFLRKNKLTNQKISNIFGEWMKDTNLQSYLLEISEKILGRSDNLIDKVKDAASQKGTGMQCVSTALNYGSICTMMSDSVFARIISSKKSMRKALSEAFGKNESEGSCENEFKIKNAFLLAKAVAYIQGYNFISEMAKINDWPIKIKTVSQIWKNGCILRGGFLDSMVKMSSYDYFEKSDLFKQIFKDGYEEMKCLLKCAIDKSVPMPCFFSALNYLNGVMIGNGSGNLIQAMRDYFGSHTVQLEGSEEFVHVDWLN